MTTHELINDLRFYVHKYAKWGNLPLKVDFGAYSNLLVTGYVPTPEPHVVFALYDSAHAQPLPTASAIEALRLYEDKSFRVYVEVAKDDVREVIGVSVDTPQKTLLLQVAA